MLSANNILGPKDGKPIVTPSQDMVLGNYYLTSEETAEGFQKQAEQARKWHNVKKAERYELYAQCEGKVFFPEEAQWPVKLSKFIFKPHCYPCKRDA